MSDGKGCPGCVVAFQVLFGLFAVLSLIAFIAACCLVMSHEDVKFNRGGYIAWYVFCILTCCLALFAAIRANFVWSMVTIVLLIILAIADYKGVDLVFSVILHGILIFVNFVFLITLCCQGKVKGNLY